MDINAMADTYQLLRDAYYGDGQFKDGGALVRHVRESSENYAKRKKLAYYLNYTGPIVNASVDPIFRNEIKREYTDTAKFKVFLDDSDRTGADLQNYIRRLAVMAKLYGVVYVIVNNEPEIGETVQDSLDKRALPYLAHVLPSEVTHWRFDDRGRMVEFGYQSTIKDSEDKTKTRYYTWTETAWAVADENKQIIRQGEHGLGRLPVVQWFGRSNDPMEALPPPEFLSVAQTNYYVYQLFGYARQRRDGYHNRHEQRAHLSAGESASAELHIAGCGPSTGADRSDRPTHRGDVPHERHRLSHRRADSEIRRRASVGLRADESTARRFCDPV